MPKPDTQLKSNDCGISAVKTIFNIFSTNIDRKYIENNIPLEEKGSRLSDLKDFFNTHSGASLVCRAFALLTCALISTYSYFPLSLPSFLPRFQ
jgi:ABC-type bacteriocin/lantibiotic exporter with double-glycine peptidase domain